MNESQIETLLRQAPRPAPPAGLRARLQASVDMPRPAATTLSPDASRIPLWQRWLPALAYGLLFLGCLIVLGVQTSQLLNVRTQNDALRVSAASLEELRRENDRLRRLSSAVPNSRQVQEQQELQALRAEAEQLRPLAQEISTLRAENERLRAARASGAADGKAGVAPEEDPFAAQKAREDSIRCINNLKQLGLAARIWANDHNSNILPTDFLQMRNELNTPRILTCPADKSRVPVGSWDQFDGSSASYEFPSQRPDERDPYIIYSRCRIHGNLGLCDGSALQTGGRTPELILEDGNLKLRGLRGNAKRK
jgi:hypothetical protein